MRNKINLFLIINTSINYFVVSMFHKIELVSKKKLRNTYLERLDLLHFNKMSFSTTNERAMRTMRGVECEKKIINKTNISRLIVKLALKEIKYNRIKLNIFPKSL